MSDLDDLGYAASALEREPFEYFRAEYAGTAPLLARVLRATAAAAAKLPPDMAAAALRPEIDVARSILRLMADDPQPASTEEQTMPADTTPPTPLTTRGLEQALGLIAAATDAPIVAITPHGSYTFAVDHVTYDGARVVLGLREIERASEPASTTEHEMRLTVSEKDRSVWLNCSCGHAEGLGAWPTPYAVRSAAQQHRSA